MKITPTICRHVHTYLIGILGIIVLTACSSDALINTVFKATQFTVNVTTDSADASVGDGVCRDSNGKCSLRAAIMEANTYKGSDDDWSTVTIILEEATYGLTLSGNADNPGAVGDLDITRDNLIIQGKGKGKTIIDAGGSSRAFNIYHGGFRTPSSLNIEIKNLTVTNGFAIESSGGALAVSWCGIGSGCFGSVQELKLTNLEFKNSRASKNGGCLFIGKENAVILTNVTVSGCEADGLGGGIYTFTSTIKNSTITKNTSSSGGGIYITDNSIYQDGIVQLDNVTVSNNYAKDQGGGVYVEDELILSSSTVENNRALNSGGGVYLERNTKATIEKSSFTRNVVEIDNGSGGGVIINNAFSFTAKDTTFRENSAAFGGAILSFSATPSITNSTFSANSASKSGGAIYMNETDSGVLSINSTTFANNTANTSGAAVYAFKGNMALKNSILQASQGSNCTFESAAKFATSSSNIISDNSCNLTNSGNLQNTNAQLGSFANYGGTTKTHLPKATSPAIDRIESALCPVNDQRGVERPQGGKCDVGAIERKSDDPNP